MDGRDEPGHGARGDGLRVLLQFRLIPAFDDQRIDDGHALAWWVDDDRVQVDFVDMVGVVGGKARQGGDQFGERCAVGRRGAAHAVEQSRALKFGEQGKRLVGDDRHRRESDIAQDLDMDAAEPDHQHRAEIGVAGDA